MPDSLLSGHEAGFALRLAVALVLGFLIGIERESRGKPAGISTNAFVIGGAAMFVYLAVIADPSSSARVVAQVVSGVGFLGAGIILRAESGAITNLTTAASVWFSAAVGIAIGMGWFVIAAIAAAYATIVPRIPHVSKWARGQDP